MVHQTHDVKPTYVDAARNTREGKINLELKLVTSNVQLPIPTEDNFIFEYRCEAIAKVFRSPFPTAGPQVGIVPSYAISRSDSVSEYLHKSVKAYRKM